MLSVLQGNLAESLKLVRCDVNTHNGPILVRIFGEECRRISYPRLRIDWSNEGIKRVWYAALGASLHADSIRPVIDVQTRSKETKARASSAMIWTLSIQRPGTCRTGFLAVFWELDS